MIILAGSSKLEFKLVIEYLETISWLFRKSRVNIKFSFLYWHLLAHTYCHGWTIKEMKNYSIYRGSLLFEMYCLFTFLSWCTCASQVITRTIFTEWCLTEEPLQLQQTVNKWQGRQLQLLLHSLEKNKLCWDWKH